MINTKKTQRVETYHRIKNEIPDRLKIVLNAVKEIQPCTYKQLTEHLNERDNAVTSRISDLLKIGMIKVVGKQKEGKCNTSLFEAYEEEESKAKQRELMEKYQEEIKDLKTDIEDPNSTIKETTRKCVLAKLKNIKKTFSLLQKCLDEVRPEENPPL